MPKRHPIQTDALINHVDMLNDKPRNLWFEQRIQAACSNKTVLEVGGGSGLLTYYALTAGAQHVYVVEQDPKTCQLLDRILAKCFSRDKYTVIEGNFWTEEIEDQIPKNSIDVFISETLGGAGIDEGILSTWWCSQKFCKPDCVYIPEQTGIEVMHWETHGFLGDAPDLAQNLIEGRVPDKFLQAVVDTDAEDIRLFQWREVANYLPKGRYEAPKLLYQKTWTPSKLPEFNFDLPFPNNVFPLVEFTITVPRGLIGFIPTMNGEYLYEFDHLGWRRAPFYYVPETVTYTIKYKDSDSLDSQWVNNQWVDNQWVILKQ